MIIAPRIIAVDNELEHLTALERAFDGLGGLCECIEFTRASERAVPFRSGVRILFMDINLMPGAGGGPFTARTGSPIAATIRKLISPDNGPYALVTWTANVAMHTDLVNFLDNSLDQELRPCATYCLPKEGHIDDPPALMAKLQTLHGEIPGLAMLLDWERAVTEAADRSVRQIARLSGLHGLAQGGAVAQAVWAISEAATGGKEAGERPFRAFSQGMSPVLTDQLDRGEPVAETEDAWKKALALTPAAPDARQRAALNTFFQMEAPSSAASASLGAVYNLPFSALKEYFGRTYKTSQAAVLSNEFVPIRQGRLQSAAEKRSFARACKWRIIQLGAPCDHANGKIKVLDCLVALEVPESCFADTVLVKDSRLNDTPDRKEWLFQTPPFLSKTGRYVLVVNLRFRIGLPLAMTATLTRIGRLREGLASEIATHSANFGTRPGIIEFRAS